MISSVNKDLHEEGVHLKFGGLGDKSETSGIKSAPNNPSGTQNYYLLI